MGKISHSILWKLFERGGVQVTQFVVSIVIARLLLPAAYGAIALLMIFISLATVFVQSGLNTALIQKKDADNSDISAVTIYSLIIASILYGALALSSHWIAQFFNIPELAKLLPILALTLFPGAINSIQLAILSKQMRFKEQFVAGIISSIVSGIIGISLAYHNFEAWSLVGQQLSYQILICIILSFMARWQLTLRISISRTKSLLSYGTKLLGARLIDTLYHNLESFIIGKAFSPATLAFCNKGKQFPLTLIDNIDGSIQSVMLPAYAATQDDITRVKALLRRTISLSTYIVFPAMFLLAAAGRPTILLLLGDNWIECVPYLQLFCVIAMLFPLQTANIQAINAIGRSDVYLKLMAWKRMAGVVLLLGSVIIWDSPFAVVIAALLAEIFAVIINAPYNYSLFNYTLKELLCDIIPNLSISLIMGCICWVLTNAINNIILLLLSQIIVGLLAFVVLSKLTNNHNLIQILNMLHINKRLKFEQ